ncbi:hypothetical protein NSQ59_04710 [Margalitia sp. FSL K6-0131]|uniref:hypothetical protein n=1 Tax=Margalitia sp. FSL K6-0131 TaxID=2954604 RepID=UPI0030F74FE5
MNLKSGSIDRFEQYSQFHSLQEFNSHIGMWLSSCKKEFTKGEIVALKRLVRFSARIPGVCNAKIGTLLKAIHDEFDGNGISRSTFKRMTAKAAQLGIITIYKTERKNGSQSSNLYVFNFFPNHEPPKEEKLDHPNKTNNPSKTINNLKKRKESELDYTFTNDSVPQSFVQFAKYFFSDAKTIEEYWRMTMIAAYRNNREKEYDKVLEYSISALKQLIRKMKLTKNGVRNPIAYFYGILNKKLEELYFEELFEMGFW